MQKAWSAGRTLAAASRAACGTTAPDGKQLGRSCSYRKLVAALEEVGCRLGAFVDIQVDHQIALARLYDYAHLWTTAAPGPRGCVALRTGGALESPLLRSCRRGGGGGGDETGGVAPQRRDLVCDNRRVLEGQRRPRAFVAMAAAARRAPARRSASPNEPRELPAAYL